MPGETRGPTGAALGRLHRRQRERRAGMGSVLASLTPALARADAPLRALFEEGMRRLINAQHLRLRDGTTDQAAAPQGLAHRLALPVPTADPMPAVVVEAVSQPHRRFDDWDVQVLTLATQVAALVLEIERTRHGARSGALVGQPRDGAAPFIGSTPAVRALRQTIERVAATDFTVLIEGAM